jgi:hypothetical protein
MNLTRAKPQWNRMLVWGWTPDGKFSYEQFAQVSVLQQRTQWIS